ncbi:MAG TPA: hypothetical protein VGF59_19100 [Bryobacteraceae bacterium]
MNPLAFLLLLAASTNLELVNEIVPIPAREWRYVEFGLNQKPAVVMAMYTVESGATSVRLAVIRREDLERLRQDQPHGVLAATRPGKAGALSHQVRRPGDYVVVVDNRDGSSPARVRLRVSLDFSPRRLGPEVTRLSPERQLAVIVISFAVFFGIVAYSGRKLLRAIRR